MDKKQINEWSKMNSKFDFNEKFVRQNMKKENKGFQYLLRGCLITLVCMFVLANVSQNYVQALQGVPFLNTVNEWLRIDSYNLAKEKDYVQEINLTKKENGVTLTVHDVVLDERNMFVNYTVDFGNKEYDMHKIKLINDNNATFYVGTVFQTDVEPMVVECNTLDSRIMDSFTFEVIYGDYERISVDVPIDIKKIADPEVYDMNQMVIIDNQKLVIERLEVYPLATYLYVKADKNNTMKVINVDFEFSVDGNVIETKRGDGYYNGNAATYVNMSPYFYDKDVEIVLKSVQLQPFDNRVSVHLDTKEIKGYTECIELVGIYEKEVGKPFEQSLFKFNPEDYDGTNDYLVLLKGKNANLAKARMSYQNKGIDIYTYYPLSDVVEIRVDKEKLNYWSYFTFEAEIGRTVEVNEKLKLK